MPRTKAASSPDSIPNLPKQIAKCYVVLTRNLLRGPICQRVEKVNVEEVPLLVEPRKLIQRRRRRTAMLTQMAHDHRKVQPLEEPIQCARGAAFAFNIERCCRPQDRGQHRKEIPMRRPQRPI